MYPDKLYYQTSKFSRHLEKTLRRPLWMYQRRLSFSRLLIQTSSCISALTRRSSATICSRPCRWDISPRDTTICPLSSPHIDSQDKGEGPQRTPNHVEEFQPIDINRLQQKKCSESSNRMHWSTCWICSSDHNAAMYTSPHRLAWWNTIWGLCDIKCITTLGKGGGHSS